MGKPQIIHTEGEDLVVIPRRDYEALLARAGDEASEDAMTGRIIAATDAKIARERISPYRQPCGLQSKTVSIRSARYANIVGSRRSKSPNEPVFVRAILQISSPARRNDRPLLLKR